MLLGTDPSRHQVILYAMSQSEIVVARSGDITILDEGEVEMTVETFLDFSDIFNLRDSADGDLLALINVRHRATHFDTQLLDKGTLATTKRSSSEKKFHKSILLEGDRQIFTVRSLRSE
jgi:hypothetical protein